MTFSQFEIEHGVIFPPNLFTTSSSLYPRIQIELSELTDKLEGEYVNGSDGEL
jgi:hypothetical protein